MCLPTSARKRLPSPAKPNVEGIQRSSFYGGAPSPANSSKVDKVLKERSLNSSSNSLNSSKATENDDDDDEDDTPKEEEESENVKGEPEKKKIKLDPDSGKKRNTPTPVNKGIRKLKKVTTLFCSVVLL